MREAAERVLWRKLQAKSRAATPRTVTLEAFELDLTEPCLILGGRNGAGKSRALRSLSATLGTDGLYLNAHHLCEQVLMTLRRRDDLLEMRDEYDPQAPDPSRRDDLQRIVGREYEEIDWYAFEMEPTDPDISDLFKWGGEQSLVPYFEVTYKGLRYNSGEMGLGEFSAHLLLWILEQYREQTGLTLLLDEPDAYLPPVGVISLLSRLLGICLERDWRLVLATHSTETIEEAVAAGAFVLLRTEDDGSTSATSSIDAPDAADALLHPRSVRRVAVVEDESACRMLEALLATLGRPFLETTEIIWGTGAGDVLKVRDHLPRSPAPKVGFVCVFDGDQRSQVRPGQGERWPSLFLPTDQDPDEIFRTARTSPAHLAERLGAPVGELSRFLDQYEASDAHDWVNHLADRYGRLHTLRALAELWVSSHPAESETFLTEFAALTG